MCAALRQCVAVGEGTGTYTTVEGVIEDHGRAGLWKLLLGRQSQAGWTGLHSPNTSSAWNSSTSVSDCGAGCLFRLDVDPTEHVNLAEHELARVASMKASIVKHNTSTFSPHRGVPHMEEACKVALGSYGGFWGPFLP